MRVYLDKHVCNGNRMRTFSGYFDVTPREEMEAAALEYVSWEERDAWWWDFIERRSSNPLDGTRLWDAS